MIFRKLVMKFIKDRDHLGNEKYKKVSLNVRSELSDELLRETVNLYCGLTTNELVEATVVDTRVLVNNSDLYEIEEIFYDEEQEEPTIKNVEADEPKGTENSPDTKQIPDKADIPEVEFIPDKEKEPTVKNEEADKPKEAENSSDHEKISDEADIPEVEFTPDKEEEPTVKNEETAEPKGAENSPDIEKIPDKTDSSEVEFIPDKEKGPTVDFSPNQIEEPEVKITSNKGVIANMEPKVASKQEKGWSSLWVPETIKYLDNQIMDNFIKKNKKRKSAKPCPLPTLLSRDYLPLPLVSSNVKKEGFYYAD